MAEVKALPLFGQIAGPFVPPISPFQRPADRRKTVQMGADIGDRVEEFVIEKALDELKDKAVQYGDELLALKQAPIFGAASYVLFNPVPLSSGAELGPGNPFWEERQRRLRARARFQRFDKRDP